MKDIATMPLMNKNDNEGKNLFGASFSLYKGDNFVMQEKVEILAYNQEHFMGRFGYQKKLQDATLLAKQGNYVLVIGIYQITN
jgi:hypothetical protein